VCVAIPHIQALDLLAIAVDLWRLQTVKPYILIVDTGAPWEAVQRLEAMRADDLEIHYVRAGGYIHSSAPVSLGMDLAFARCPTTYLFSTHMDVFPRRRDFLAWMLGQCDADTPVVGWEQSPRHDPGYKGCVSHTATMWHMPTMRAKSISWGWEYWYSVHGLPARPTIGYPDTEQPVNLRLREAGIVPKLLGGEPNFERHVTEWFDHPRSVAGARAQPMHERLKRKVLAYLPAALADAKARLAEWKALDSLAYPG
jgi:hypothetical protein